MKEIEWKKTLAFGNSYEELLKTLIPHNECIQSTSSEYDLMLDGKKYEVKADRFMFKTGNVLIEYESNKKLSGISVTEADYYAIFEIDGTKHELYLVPVKDIKELISQKFYKAKISCGYNKLSKCYLFDKFHFEVFSQEIKD